MSITVSRIKRLLEFDQRSFVMIAQHAFDLMPSITDLGSLTSH
jgi:hypothetical protein